MVSNEPMPSEKFSLKSMFKKAHFKQHRSKFILSVILLWQVIGIPVLFLDMSGWVDGITGVLMLVFGAFGCMLFAMIGPAWFIHEFSKHKVRDTGTQEEKDFLIGWAGAFILLQIIGAVLFSLNIRSYEHVNG